MFTMMTMKPSPTLLRAARLAGVMLAGSVVLAGQAAAKPVRVNLATLAPTGTSFHIALQEMGQEWKKAPDGGVNLVIFPDGRMGDEGDMVRKMRPANGQIQAGLLTIAGLSDIHENVSGLQTIPMAYRSLEEAAFVRSKLAPKLEAAMAEKGFTVLGWCDSGWWRLFAKTPLLSPADVTGQKMMITKNSPGLAKLVSSLGMQPVELNPTDILVSLQTGLITVTASPPIYALQGQFFQPAPHMLELNWLPLVGGLVLKRATWEQLTPAQQEVVRASANRTMKKITEAGRREMVESIEAMEKRGLKVHHFAGAEEKAWLDFFAGVQRDARGTLVPESTYDEVMKLLEDYRAGAR
jgi:TRAP-type C4-dicarboxylate transport system substrate-binding protein